MTFGLGTTSTSLTAVRIHGPENIQSFLDTFRSYGHTEIDTARIYGNGETEEALALQPHGPENLGPTFRASLKALQVDKVDILYLHAPDYTTPFEETLKAVDELYREGLFNKLGLSNYSAFQVAWVYEICKQNGYILPTMYQGMYNPITRDAVQELFPCLKAFEIAFDAYNPLAGGLLSGKYQFEDSVVKDGSRYDSKMGFGKIYRERYWNGLFLKAIQDLKTIAEALGFSLVDVTLRWMMHHSGFGPNDGIVMGASCVSHLKSNLDILDYGEPLPEEMVKAFDVAWEYVQPVCPPYFKTEGVIKTYLPTTLDS
ncbi:MAG: Aldo/keto reductase [Podila humilis]|nr:MAG: Aldo/keto reductase [Podila humilis]